jgi:hypothetical protein
VVSLPDEPAQEEPPNDYDRGYAEGWQKRRRKEGWPLSRREAME